MLNAEDDRQGDRADRGSQGKQPRRRRRRFGDATDPLTRFVGRKPARFSLRDSLHYGSDAIHVDTGRIGRDVRGWRCHATIRTQLQLAPAWQDLSADTELFAEPLAGSDDLISGLAVDKESPCEGKDQLGTVLIGHGRFSGP